MGLIPKSTPANTTLDTYSLIWSFFWPSYSK